MPDWFFCLVFASRQGSCSTFPCCSKETSQGCFCPWGYLHTVAESSGNPLPLKGLFSSFPKGFLPFLCCLIIFRPQEAETSLPLPGLHKEVKSLIHGYSLLPTDSFLHPPHLSGKPGFIACPLQHLFQGGVMAEVPPGTPPA